MIQKTDEELVELARDVDSAPQIAATTGLGISGVHLQSIRLVDRTQQSTD